MAEYNASDRKDIRRAEKSAKLAEANRRAVLVGLMSTIPGREWVWNKLAEASIFATTYSDSTNRMYFLEGQRAFGLALLDDILAACPDQFIQAMREQNARRTERDAADATRSDRDLGERPSGEEPGWDDQGPSADDVSHLNYGIEDRA